MASIAEQMYTILSGMAALTALVPEERIHFGEAPQNTVLPYVVHFPVSLVPVLCHEGPQAIRKWDFYQISIYAASAQSGNDIANVLLANLPGNHSGVMVFTRTGSPWFQAGGSQNERETVRSKHFPLDFEVWEAL